MAGGGRLAQTIDLIVTRHHAYLHRALPRLQTLAAAARAEDRGSERTKVEAVERIVAAASVDLEHHMLAEESGVFPVIRRMEEGDAEAAGVAKHLVRHLEAEHSGSLEALAKIREITSEFTLPAGAGRSLRELYEALRDLDADLREHVRIEREVLFRETGAL